MMMESSRLRNLHEEYGAALRAAIHAPNHQTPPEESESAGVEYLPYGPSTAGDESAVSSIEIVATYGPVEAEYAAIRRGAGILDRPQRGVIRVTGADRRGFLNRLLTQDLKDLGPATPHSVKRSFWLNRKGRIEADLFVIEREHETLLDLDRHQCASTVASLQAFLFTEDVEIADTTDEFHRIAVYGKRACEVAAAATGIGFFLLSPGEAREVSIAGAPVTTARNDETGEVGVELFVRGDDAPRVWRALVATDEALSAGRRRIRPIGWHAYNIARIEAGTALFNVDFGPTNLPHETGVLSDRVSFTKGCYLGQEVVARMEHLGKPKQILVGLRVTGDLLPVAGAQVFEIRDGSLGDQIGEITSSTPSPMLGAAPIAFTIIRSKFAEPGTQVLVNAEGTQATATVHPLRFWPAEVHHAEHGGPGEKT